MIALARGKRGQHFKKNMRYEELKMGIPEFGFRAPLGQEAQIPSFASFNLASYATLAKVFEEITEIPALGVEVI
jgi:hypothetical protein